MNESDRIYVEEASLQQLKESFKTAGDDYLKNLTKLENLIGQITNGDIRGDLANEFEKKYEAKKDTFQGLKDTIKEADEYMGIKREDFASTLANTLSDMG